MKRTQIYLTDKEVEGLRPLAEEYGISLSEYIRRVLDNHLKSVQKKKS